jgi:hypothetical protein
MSRQHEAVYGMSGVIRQTAMLGQANGPEVELVVTGTKTYATYETPDGYPAVYDDSLGLFCYARVIQGEYESTAVPVSSGPPPGVVKHAAESDEVRASKIEDNERRRRSRE